MNLKHIHYIIVVLDILQMSFFIITALTMGEWRVYKTLHECPTTYHTTLNQGALQTRTASSSVSCLLGCLRHSQCVSVFYDSLESICILLDKDYLVCIEDIGVIEAVRSSYCANNGTLVSETSCACSDDFGSTFCDADAYRVDDCEGVTCHNGGTCVDLYNGYRCTCTSQYTGTNCEIGFENIALNRATYASSVHDEDGASSHAVDGDASPDWGHLSCASTLGHGTTNPWWAVDFEMVRTVYSVAVTNRGDCCPERLHDFETYVSSDTHNPLQSMDKQLCASYAGEVGGGETLDLMCATLLTGRYFSILIPGAAEVVTVCEVVILGA